MKVLFIANSDRHIKLCHIPYLKLFHDNNYIVHVATNTNTKIPFCDTKINLKLKRNPYSFLNLFAVFKIRKLIKHEKYDLISCHTPIGGFLGRVGAIGTKTKVFYTAHGFHFYKGAPIINWIIYYPIEKFLSRFTTAIITMNEEDYLIALKKFHTKIYKINGIGYNSSRLKITNNNLKKELKLENYFIVTYIAEISKRKNQLNLIKELNKIDLEKEKIKVLLIGDSIIPNFKDKIKNNNIIYLGFKENVGDYINISDIFISASLQEGLPLCILEAMYFNKYIIGLNIRGNKDLINNKNGLLVNNLEELVNEILIYKNNNKKIINNNINKYKLNQVMKTIIKIYNKYLLNKLKIYIDK